jgi:hypothetical protein
MSIDVSCFLVNWSEFVRRISDSDQFEPYSAIDERDAADWIARPDVEFFPYSLNLDLEISLGFEAFTSALPADERHSLGAFLSGISAHQYPLGLDKFKKSDGPKLNSESVAYSISPQSVKDRLALVQGIDLQGLSKRLSSKSESQRQIADAMLEVVSAWKTVFQSAVARQWGVVEVVI